MYQEHEGVAAYLIYEFADKKDVKGIKQQLVERKLDVLELSAGDSSLDTRRKHYANLVNCDSSVIYYGETNPIWLETKINDLRKAPGMGRKGPVPVKIIYCGAGVEVPDWESIKNEFVVVHDDKDFTSTLDSLLTQFNQSKTR